MTKICSCITVLSAKNILSPTARRFVQFSKDFNPSETNLTRNLYRLALISTPRLSFRVSCISWHNLVPGTFWPISYIRNLHCISCKRNLLAKLPFTCHVYLNSVEKILLTLIIGLIVVLSINSWYHSVYSECSDIEGLANRIN